VLYNTPKVSYQRSGCTSRRRNSNAWFSLSHAVTSGFVVDVVFNRLRPATGLGPFSIFGRSSPILYAPMPTRPHPCHRLRMTLPRNGRCPAVQSWTAIKYGIRNITWRIPEFDPDGHPGDRTRCLRSSRVPERSNPNAIMSYGEGLGMEKCWPREMMMTQSE